ncbi:MAG: Glu-tRNA(Gln) amidotransferase subunit GatE [Candidatus Pacearchaeota archaeon]|nr:Glu-tRNA(Gln) amidotransferase subunit GatE [Nanoarchaeota archaeon]MDZ4226583.1 Glu-tRNA(Gln) amidotransferase subunit GatE [Candidatus Pacearchaeota archaeon]
MPELDYEQLGLRCGLEIHQQLDTRKLFCNCPSFLRKDEPKFKVRRRLHVVPGESGEVDIAAAHEATKEKEFTYEGYDTTCLVELDEEPPHEINKEALSIAIQIALTLNCKILPITQIMRKTVIDGSNTSGFQRTVLIARDGFIETSHGRIGIATLCLEEDSARIIDKDKGVFRLDRLGIPLVEIATDAEIKTPSQAREAAMKLGEILRTLPVKRGLGTIRQDVNLSIVGGKRVELKGFQDIRNIERAIEKEVARQQTLVKQGKSMAEVRAVNEDGSSRFLRPLPGAARMYPETDVPLLKISRDFINEAKKEISMQKKPEEELEKHGLSREMISLLLKRKKIEEFKELLQVLNKPQLVAKTILIFSKEIASKEKKSLAEIEKILNRDVLANVLEDVKKGKISDHNVKDILENIVKGESAEVEQIDESEIEEKISRIIKEKPGLSANAYMGIVMKEFRGRISGKEASEMIKKHIK